MRSQRRSFPGRLDDDLLGLVLQLFPQLVQARAKLLLLGQERGKLLLPGGLIGSLLLRKHVVQELLHPGVIDVQAVEDLQGFLVFSLSLVVRGLLQAGGDAAGVRGFFQGYPEESPPRCQDAQDDDPGDEETPRSPALFRLPRREIVRRARGPRAAFS